MEKYTIFSKGDIGKQYYPTDNSYMINLSNLYAPDIRLAGTIFEPAKLVTIISEPYKHLITEFGESRQLEFVTVEYNGDWFRVLNRFITYNK